MRSQWWPIPLACAAFIGGTAGARAQATDALVVCHAGSLSAAFSAVEREFTARHPAVHVTDVSGGSVALASRLAAGTQACDVFAAADYLDVDLLLKPAGIAEFTVVVAKGRMVLAYLATDPLARGVAAPGDFAPPATIPAAAADWYRAILQPGARVTGSHPFLDPAGYRSHMIFQLAQAHYGTANLSNLLLEHYTILPDVGGPSAGGRTLGTDFNFQLIYEHSAAAAAKTNPAYRYVRLPDDIDLSSPDRARGYAHASVTIPGASIRGIATPVVIPGARVAWGLTIPSRSTHRDEAIAFVELLLGPVGTAALTTFGPEPVTPAYVSRRDVTRLPPPLRQLVRAGDAAP